MESSRDATRKQKLLMGTCGWSDNTLLRCGRFYPASVRTAEDRLRHYSTYFPCVEVDTSTYAIPSKASVQRWVQSVPSGFVFHFKAFGLFCSQSCPFTAIPGDIRCKLASPGGEDNIKLSSLSTSTQAEVWKAFNNVLEPAYNVGSLGVILFQFHLSFKPSKENQAHVLWCRRHLDSRFPMAVEFRCRDWFAGDSFQATCEWLRTNELTIVAADELAHETFQKDREQAGLPEGQKRTVLPVAWAVTQPSVQYIRVHRREGNKRVLSESELQTWVVRLQSKILESLQGPIYFMWGTDWEDQPIVNARNLTQLLPHHMIFEWKAAQNAKPTKGSLLSHFKAIQPSPSQPSIAAPSIKAISNQTTDFSHASCQKTEIESDVDKDNESDLGSVDAKLDFLGQKRIIEPSSDVIEPIRKVIALPSLAKETKKTTPVRKQGAKSQSTATPCTITSFFKRTTSDT